MSGSDVVLAIVGLIGSGTIGAVAVEILRGRRESKRDKVKVPAEAEQFVSAGAKDAVEAIRTTLGELRTDLASQREKCDVLERLYDEQAAENREIKVALAEAKDDLRVERNRRKALEADVRRLRERVESGS